ncbi:MAG: hypothetical protein ACPHCJ_06445, partial [Oceanococcaceae bacterium]
MILLVGCAEHPEEGASSIEVTSGNAELPSGAYRVMENHWGSGEQTDAATRLSFRFDQPTSCEY